jgi:hypothetical protein
VASKLPLLPEPLKVSNSNQGFAHGELLSDLLQIITNRVISLRLVSSKMERLRTTTATRWLRRRIRWRWETATTRRVSIGRFGENLRTVIPVGVLSHRNFGLYDFLKCFNCVW